MAQGGAASSKPVMPFYTLNLRTQEKVLALEEKWQVHFDWLTDVVVEAKVKFAKAGEERELSLLTQTPGPKRTRTARKNKASGTQDQEEVDVKTRTTKSKRTTKAAQKSSMSAIEENHNKENSELSAPDSRNENLEKSNSGVVDPGAGLLHPKSGLRVEDVNESSSERTKQSDSSKAEDTLQEMPVVDPTEYNEEIAAKNQEISVCLREDATFELVLENTNELSETITKEQGNQKSIENEEPALEFDEASEVFEPGTDEINGFSVKTSEEFKDNPEIETEHVETVKKSFQIEETNEDIVDDVFETTREIKSKENNVDIENDHLHNANNFAKSVASESTSVGKSFSSITSDKNLQLVSPQPPSFANATFTVDEEIQFRRETESNLVNSTFVVESRQSAMSQVDDTVYESYEKDNANIDETVSEVNKTVDDSLNKRENSFRHRNNTVNIESGESRLSHNLVESNQVASPSEQIQSLLSIPGKTINEQDSVVDQEDSNLETVVDPNVNDLLVHATPAEPSVAKQNKSTSVPSEENNNKRFSQNVSQDGQVSSSQSVGKSSKKTLISSEGSGKVSASSNCVSQQETSDLRETRSSRSSRSRSTKESVSSERQDKPPTRARKSVSQDGGKSARSNPDPKEKSVRSTRSKQKQNDLEESDSAKNKDNHSQPFDGQKSENFSHSTKPGDSHSSQSESDNDDAPSTRNDRSGSVLQQKSASRRSRRSSIASSLLKVSASRKHSVVDLLQTMEGSLVTLVSTDSPARASALASKSSGTGQSRSKVGKVTKPKKAVKGVASSARGVTPGSMYRGMTPGTVGSARTTPGSVVGSRTTPGSVVGSRTTPGSVGSHNGGRVRSRLGIMQKASRGTPGKTAQNSQPNRSRHPSTSEQMEEEKKMQEKAAEALKKKEELMKQKTDEQRNKREARIKRVQEARQAKENEIRIKNEVKESEEKLAEQAKKERKLKEDAERRRINEERQKEAEERKAREEQAMIALTAELKKKEAALEAELRNREAAERAKKIRDEEEKREKKEEERQLQAEAKQQEAEKIAREKEKLRKAQAEELKEKNNLNSTYTKPSSALDQSKCAGPSSYDMTPSRHAGNLPPEPLENENDYGLDDLDSEGSTDDEDQPRKEVPKWAEGGLLRTALLKQSYMGPDLDPHRDARTHRYVCPP